MTRDPIIEELRKRRHQTETACDNDWDKLFEHFRRVQETVSDRIVSRSPKPSHRAIPDSGGLTVTQ